MKMAKTVITIDSNVKYTNHTILIPKSKRYFPSVGRMMNNGMQPIMAKIINSITVEIKLFRRDTLSVLLTARARFRVIYKVTPLLLLPAKVSMMSTPCIKLRPTVQLSHDQFITASIVKNTAMVISEMANAKKSRVDEVILRLPMSQMTKMTTELKKIDKMEKAATKGFPEGSKMGRQMDTLLESPTI